MGRTPEHRAQSGSAIDPDPSRAARLSTSQCRPAEFRVFVCRHFAYARTSCPTESHDNAVSAHLGPTTESSVVAKNFVNA